MQTPWLTAFLKDPYPIRPAAQLRMPRFHYSKLDDVSPHDTRELANYFPASDGADFPYQPIPEREQDYLSKLERQHPGYLGAGWQMMTKGACVQCHAIGQYQPTGGAEVVNGPDLRQVSPRFRPGYLAEWLANPRRLIPYTAMPQNIPPHGPPPPAVPKTFEDQPLEMVKAMRDTLLNYVNAVEGQLASAQPGASKPQADPRSRRPRRPTPPRPREVPSNAPERGRLGDPPGSPEPDVRDRSDYNAMASRAGPCRSGPDLPCTRLHHGEPR